MKEFRALVLLLLSVTAPFSIPGSASIVPGDAEWLGDYGAGEDIPDVFDYLPYSYVIFGSGKVAIPRLLIAPEEDCPQLVVEDESIDLPIPKVVTRAVGNKSLPHAFPIRVCEVRIELDSHKIAWTRGSLHFDGIYETVPIKTDPKRFLLIGDTGLRIKPENLGLGVCNATFTFYGLNQCFENVTEADLTSDVSGEFQALNEWPFQTLQTFAAEEAADVVVHVGDFLYRQGPCPERSNTECVAVNGPPRFEISDLGHEVANFLPGTWGDNLHGWWADLFWPSMALFKASPWIALRGNHENCARGGHGYSLFFGIDEYPQDTVAGEYCVDIFPPFAVSFLHEQFLVLDSSSITPKGGGIDHYNFVPGACPTKRGPLDPPIVAFPTSRYDDPAQDPAKIQSQVDSYTAMFETLRLLSLSHDTNFLSTHHPVFAIACNFTRLESSDWTLQQALGPTTLERVSAFLNGHMHWLQVLLYEDFPPHLLVGHGGTKFIPNYPDQSAWPGVVVSAGRDNMYSSVVESGMSSSEMHGYAIMERNDDGNYDVVLKGLKEDVWLMVELDYKFSIPKGPFVPKNSPTVKQSSPPKIRGSTDTRPDGMWILQKLPLLPMFPFAWFGFLLGAL